MSSYKGQWKYFRSLLFLKDQFTPRISGGSFTITDEDEVINDISKNSEEDKEYVDENQLSMPLAGETVSPEQYTESVAPFSSRPSSSAGSHRNINTKKKRPASEDIGSALLEAEKKKMQYLEEKRLQKADGDDDLNFFKSLLPHDKTLSPYNKMSYRMKILKVTREFLTSSDRTESSSNPTTINISNNSATNHTTESYINETSTAKSYYKLSGKSGHSTFRTIPFIVFLPKFELKEINRL